MTSNQENKVKIAFAGVTVIMLCLATAMFPQGRWLMQWFVIWISDSNHLFGLWLLFLAWSVWNLGDFVFSKGAFDKVPDIIPALMFLACIILVLSALLYLSGLIRYDV